MAARKTLGDAIIRGSALIGSASGSASAILELVSSDKAFILPRLTQAQRDAITPEVGMQIYNTDSNFVERYNGTAWGFDGNNNDNDGDTGIDVERSVDEDIAYLKAAGSDKMVITLAGIGIDGVPVASAALTINSTTQGFLPPRMTTAQRDAIASPVEGLQIWNTDNKQPEVYNGTQWRGI